MRESVNLSMEVAPHARLQNRTWEFPLIRLLARLTLDMGTRLSWEIACSTVYPVVAVTVYGCQVSHLVIAMIPIFMMNFNRIVSMEVKSTFSTFAFLAFNGSWDFGTNSRVCSPSFTPISPVPIVRRCCSFDFDMAINRGFGVSKKFYSFIAEYPPKASVNVPVSVGNPPFIFLWMSELCPPKRVY